MVEKPAYTTEKKEERRRLTLAGEPITVYLIWATSAKGTRYHVEVQEDQLDRAPEILAARAKELDAI